MLHLFYQPLIGFVLMSRKFTGKPIHEANFSHYHFLDDGFKLTG